MFCHSKFPRGIRCYISALLFPRSCRQAPPVLVQFSPFLLPPPPPPPPTTGTVLSLCLEVDRCKLVGTHNLWGVTPGSPSPHFAPFCLPQGVPRWARQVGKKRKREFCTSHSLRCHVVASYGRKRVFFSENLSKKKMSFTSKGRFWSTVCVCVFRDNKVCTCACVCLRIWLCVKQLNADGQYVSFSSHAPCTHFI